ncbi:hypothetical protein [Sphingobacterium chuzhouense]|uniref:hypothetical protein n=1 Tax=Sphingobacterium chuzhouense TaxID=1742264 RepID=UPI0036D383C8
MMLTSVRMSSACIKLNAKWKGGSLAIAEHAQAIWASHVDLKTTIGRRRMCLLLENY